MKNICKANIPDELKDISSWIVWRYEQLNGKETKIPYNPNKPNSKARSNDPKTWGTFDKSLEVLEREDFDGVGFEFSPPYVGIDYDHVRDPDTGKIDWEVRMELMDLDSYTEISPSGNGLHVIVKGEIPRGRKHGNREMYTEDRYFTVTGNSLTNTPKGINEPQEVIDTLYRQWFGDDETSSTDNAPHKSSRDAGKSVIPDAMIIKLCEQDTNGEKFSALWQGDHSEYPSQSEADLALCSLLVHRTRDKEQVDRIFRKSGLYRPKWDEKRGKFTYGEKTISKAFAGLETHSDNGKENGRNKKIKPWFEKDGKIYLQVVTSDDKCEFVHTENDELIFSSKETDERGNSIYPVPLIIHENSGEVVPIVGIPRKDNLELAAVLPISALYKEIKTHLNRYIDAPDVDVDMFVLFILFSWFYIKTNTVPYLRFLGDTGKGKSRFLKVISDLCFYPVIAEGASTASGIIRFNKKWLGTLKIDEADLRDGGAENELVKYINLGFEKGHFFIKTDKVDPKLQETFDPFCPKLFAMREPFQDNAIEGRLLSFSPSETQRKDIPYILPPVYEETVHHLRAKITRYVLHIWPDVDGSKMLDCSSLEIEPRLKQLAMPLSIVLQLIPDGKQRFLSYLNRRQQEVKKTRAQSMEGTFFNSLYLLATGNSDTVPDYYHEMKRKYGDINYITSKMVADSVGVKPTQVTRSLKSIGFDVIGSIFGNNIVKHIVVPSRHVWREIIQRYYYNDEETEVNKEKIQCPKCLQGPQYTVTLVTDVTHAEDSALPAST